MRPVFDEFIQFIKHNGNDVDLIEGYYWIERTIIKAYDIYGQVHQVGRLHYVDNSERVKYIPYPKEDFIIASWNDIANRKSNIIKKRMQESIRTIKKSLELYPEHQPIVLYSTGKDSEVVLNLAKKLVPEIKVIYNNTTLDDADGYRKVKNTPNIQILSPKKGFYQNIKIDRFVPTRQARFCCDKYKERVMIDCLDKNNKYIFFLGMRNSESNARSSYRDIWRNVKWGNRKWEGYLPVRKWSEEEIWLYIFMNNIDFNLKYRKGYPRVGCSVICPFATRLEQLLDKYWYPYQYNRWHKIIGDIFIEDNRMLYMNCTLEEYHRSWNQGVIRNKPTKRVIKEFASRANLNYDIAKMYFNKSCSECNVTIADKEVLGMNLKFNGRTESKLYCKKHLKSRLEMTDEVWNSYVKRFKEYGCNLL